MDINLWKVTMYLAGILIVLFLAWKCFIMAIKFASPKKMIGNIANAILRTLIYIGQIKSLKSEAVTEERDRSQVITCYLKNATICEKNVFNNAVSELLSPIQNPRYIIVKTILRLFTTAKATLALRF